jgi:hypothetical protein
MILFQFPLVAACAYVEPRWPARFPQLLHTGCLGILALTVLVQLGQYFSGEPPGDNLSGTFGPHGVGELVMFILFVLCLGLGRWLAHRRWRSLVAAMVLGAAASVLGEMKLFPVAAGALGGLALLLYMGGGKQRWRVLPFAILVGIALIVFVSAYNSVVVTARDTRSLEEYLDVRVLMEYLNSSDLTASEGVLYSTFGRNYGITYGWNSIRQDAVTMLFGLGIGARGESRTLGTAGVGLQTGRLGVFTGTSLLVMIQEQGLVGMLILASILVWILVTLYREIRRDPKSEAAELRYALLLFSLLWPLWLWYGKIWLYRVPMLLYWFSLGYVMGEAARRNARAHESSPDALSLQYESR